MVGGALGQPGHHVQQHVGAVKEPGNGFVTILLPQGVEVIVLVTTPINRHATLPVVQVRSNKV